MKLQKRGDDAVTEHYNQNYTLKQIEGILNILKECIASGRYTISQNDNRNENIQLIQEYNLTSKKQKNILLSIDVTDFCHSLKNVHIGYEHEILYVFCLQRELFNIMGKSETVDIYIKFNLINKNENKFVITISFHKRNKPIHYLFR